MNTIKAKPRESRQLNYFQVRNLLSNNHSDSQSEDLNSRNSLVDIIRELSTLHLTHNAPNIFFDKSKGSLCTEITLDQKHINLYKKNWDREWIKTLPSFRADKIEQTVEEETRGKLFNWLMEVFLAYKLTKRAYFRTIMIFDLFLQTLNKPIEGPEIQLWGLAALFISVKYEEEEYRLDLETLVNLSRKRFSAIDFARAEEVMFRRLGFDVSFATFYDIWEELILRMGFYIEKYDKLRIVSENIFLRCLLRTDMLKVRADLFCASVLIYTVSLFYEHYIYFRESIGKTVNKAELEYREMMIFDGVAKVTRLNKEMINSVKEQIRDALESFEEQNRNDSLNHIAKLCDLENF